MIFKVPPREMKEHRFRIRKPPSALENMGLPLRKIFLTNLPCLQPDNKHLPDEAWPYNLTGPDVRLVTE